MKYFKLVTLAVCLVLPGLVAAKVTGLPDFTELVGETAPAVVNIRVTQFSERVNRSGGSDESQAPDMEGIPENFRRFFEGREMPRGDREGAGSGFIIDDEGYVVTNHHVIDGADEIIVRMADRREFEAVLVGSDPASDVALLKIEAKGLPMLPFGSSAELAQGEWVMAIGSPFNYDQSVTAGIVSAKGRSNGAQQYVPFIQTDVAINRGNSGGPLLNMAGEVVGVNSWILTNSGGYQGLSFSIPAEVVKTTVKQLRENGFVQRGLLGVVVGEVTREMAEAMRLDRPTGALVNDVSSNGAAQRAGIAPGDIILSFDQQPVEVWSDLPPLVGANPPGTEAEVVVSRNGEEKEFSVILDSLEPRGEGELAQEDGPAEQSNAIGLAVEALTAERRREIEAPEGGVLVTGVENDAAWRAGVRPGDIILMVNSRSINGVDDFDAAMDNIPSDKAVALRVWRDGATTFFAFTPTEDDIG